MDDSAKLAAPRPGLPGRQRDTFPTRSVKPGGYATHDYGTKTPVRRATGSGDVSVSRQFQNAELLGQETAIAFLDGLLGPLIDIGVPDWAVISGSRGNATKRVVRPMPV